MDWEYILLEAFGYIGTALVIVSMMMTNLLTLRIINMCGGAIGLIYAVICNTWPIVVLNACLIGINLFQTVRQIRENDRFCCVIANTEDASVQYFLDYHAKDIEKYFLGFRATVDKNSEIHVIFASGEPVGVFIGEKEDDVYRIKTDYIIPGYRGVATGKFLLSQLEEQGVSMITAPSVAEAHDKYLKRLGFVTESGIMIKVFK